MRYVDALLIFCSASFALAENSLPNEGFLVPEGFEVTLYAGDELAHDIYAMTIDSAGCVVVAGPDYIKTLHDDDRDGRADRATLFSEHPGSCHGLLFDGDDLLCTGRGGLWRLSDADADGVVDGRGQLLAKFGNGEHGAGGIVRGADGGYYVICGNEAGVSAAQASLPGSPVKSPNCGGLVRFTPDLKQSEVFADGFRNAYDVTVAPSGHLFTVDSDGERVVHLPWYTPTRLFDITQGRQHGWLLRGWQRSWSRPEWFYDNVERVVEIGRGSPTGMETYRHHEFPARYRDGVFSLCWTFGRVYFHRLESEGGGFRGEMETFMQTAGNIGFAPVDLAVGPSGDLFVAIGGRGTRGSVFRVRYAKGPEVKRKTETDPVRGVLIAPQPLASWSRARWRPVADRLGSAAFEQAALNSDLPIEERIRAIEILVDRYHGLPVATAEKLAADRNPQIQARTAWALSHSTDSPSVRKLMVKLTYVDDPWVQRAAWESIARLPSPLVGESPDWASALASSDRTVRWAAIQAARTTARDVQPADDGPLSARRRLARLWIAAAEGSAGIDDEGIRDLLLIIQQSPPAQRLEAIRLLQIALGDLRAVEAKPEVYSGYAAAERRELADKLDMAVVRVLVDIFPAGGQELDWEIARTWGMVGIENDEDAIPDLLAEKWTPDSSPLDDIHYLIVASLSPGERAAETTRAAADMLVRLHAKIAKLPTLPGGQWGDRVGEAVAEQFERDPALAPALVAHDDFGSPDHALYVRYLRGELRTAAIQKMLVAARSLDGEDWTTDLVGLLRELPADDVLPDFRRRWREPHLQDSIAQILARYRQGEDRERLIEALGSSDSNVAAGAASALVKMEVEPSPEQIAMALKALRRLLYVPAQKVNRERLIVLLTQWTGQRIQVREGQGKDLFADYHPWFDWFQRAHPTESEKLGGFSGKSAAAWKKRLADVDWTAGDVLRGQQVFNRTTCNRCHTGSTRLGPDLAGVAGRLSRDDLFAAIVDPSQSISPLYRSWLYQTHSGKVFVGLIVYASEAGTILLTGPGVNVRLTGEETAAMRESEISLMPAGLLDDASPGDLADLYAYLQTLKAK